MHSFQSVEQTGLIDLAQTCIEIGSHHGSINIRDAWFGRNTIQTECVKKFAEYRLSIEKILHTHVKSQTFAATTDLWKDDAIGRYYLDFTGL